MKKIIFLLVLSTFAKAKAQPFIIDTLKNASAFSSSYIPMDLFGKTRNGHIYTCGLNNRYTFKGPLPVQLVRIDMTDNTVTYKELEGTLSSPTVLLRWAFDEAGNLYAGFNTNNRKIFKFNLKDSIYYKNIGNGFKDGISVPYSMSLGTDGHIYCGGVGGKTFVSEYNPATARWTEYPVMDPANNYTLAIAGDQDYIYAETGQINSVQLWEMKKSDSTKKMLFKITNLTRIGLYTRKDGIYAEVHSDTLSGIYKLEHGIPLPVKYVASTDMAHNDLDNGAAPIPKIISHFDAGENIFSYSINNSAYQDLHLATGNLKDPLRIVFGFKNDEKNIYYAGDHYGNYYRYNVAEKRSYLLGSTGYNIYSLLPDTDSTIYFVSYPSACLMKWNKNKPWTLGKFINGVTVALSKTSNPQLLGYFKGQTAAGFHYPYATVRDFKNNVVSAGQVERIANTCSIAVYDVSKDSLYGYNFNKMRSMSFSGLASFEDHVILSTNNANGGMPKLYYYNSITNKMDDSLTLGFKDYGKIYISGKILTGIANDRIYKLDLAAKKLIQNFEFAGRSIINSSMLSDGTIIINTSNNLPEGFAKFIKLKYNSFWETKDILYATDGINLISMKKPLK